MMTQREFEAFYARNSNVTPEELNALGIVSVKCDCGESGCDGWKMTHPKVNAELSVASNRDTELLNARLNLDRELAYGMIRKVLEALCARYGLSLDSEADPGMPARNYELALRLGIGAVFGLD